MATYLLPSFLLESGSRADLELGYCAFGQLNEDKSNAIVFPTPFGANHRELQWIAGEGGLFDARRYFLIVVDTLANGFSTSPYDLQASKPWAPPGQQYSVLDNVRAQRAMLADLFGISRIALVAGWSMGGQQAYQWAASYPEAVERICVICGSARTSPHNFVFLEGIKAALHACLSSGEAAEAVSEKALRMMGRMYAAWALSQDFYRLELWRQLGYVCLEDFLAEYWERAFLKRHPLNLLAQLHTWQTCDVGRTPGCEGSLARALGRIDAQALIIPCRQDLYFRVEDNELELPFLKNASMAVMDSPWGHRAGLSAESPADCRFLRGHIDALLSAPRQASGAGGRTI